MLELEEKELLKRFAYQSWLERGQPVGSPEVDWARAKEMLKAHCERGVKTLDSALEENVSDPALKVVDAKLQKKTLGKTRRTYSVRYS